MLGTIYMPMWLRNPLQPTRSRLGIFILLCGRGDLLLWNYSPLAYWGSRPHLGANSGHRTKTYMKPQNSSPIFHSNHLQEPPQRNTFYLWSRKMQERKMAHLHKHDVFSLIFNLDNVTEMATNRTKRAATWNYVRFLLISLFTLSLSARELSWWDAKKNWVHLEGRKWYHLQEGPPLPSIQISSFLSLLRDPLIGHSFKSIYLQENLASLWIKMKPKS